MQFIDEHMRLLHRDASLRFAKLPPDLRREYLGPMLLGRFRVIFGNAAGQLLIGCGIDRWLGGRSLGDSQATFTILKSGDILVWGCGQMEFWNQRRYGYYNHSVPLLGQAAVTCAARSYSIQAGQLHRSDSDSFSVFRPDDSNVATFAPRHLWNQYLCRIPNVPIEFMVVLCRLRGLITEFVLWDGSHGIIRVFVSERTSRRAFRLHRVPVCVTEAADTESVHLTYSWGDGRSVRFEDMQKI